jgi:ankyrin repeat protein
MLHRAARAGVPELVRLLLRAGADVNAVTISGQTPLHAVAAADPFRGIVVARELVEHGADLKLRDTLGDTPVHTAAVYDRSTLLAYYASVGADLDAPNVWGATALDRAVERHQDRSVEALYELGAQTRITPSFEPPLVAAARVDDVNRARWLLAYGADPNRPFEGKSAADIARENGSPAIAALLATATARH